MGRTEPRRSAGGKKRRAQALLSPTAGDGSLGPSCAQSQGCLRPKHWSLRPGVWRVGFCRGTGRGHIHGGRIKVGQGGEAVSGPLPLPKGPRSGLPSRSGVPEASNAKEGALDEEFTSSQLHNRPSPGFPLPTGTVAMIVTGLQARPTATGRDAPGDHEAGGADTSPLPPLTASSQQRSGLAELTLASTLGCPLTGVTLGPWKLPGPVSGGLEDRKSSGQSGLAQASCLQCPWGPHSGSVGLRFGASAPRELSWNPRMDRGCHSVPNPSPHVSAKKCLGRYTA